MVITVYELLLDAKDAMLQECALTAHFHSGDSWRISKLIFWHDLPILMAEDAADP